MTDETPTDEDAAPPERASPGRLLRRAREDMRLGTDDVARDLRLAPSRVLALEADDYRTMPAPTFVRGYLRGYARLVRLPEEEVLAAYDEVQKPRVAPIAEAPKPARSVPRQARSGDKPVRAATYLLVAILVALVFSWWKNQWELPVAPTPERKTLSAEAPDRNETPAASAGQPLQAGDSAASTPATGASPGQETASSPSSAPAANAAVPAEPAAKAAGGSTTAASAETAKKPAPGEPKPVAVATAAKPAPATPPAIAENTVQVSLVFDGESWADLRDARRQRLVYQQFKAGQSVTVAGVPPFKVYLSNAGVVRMRYAGEPYDVSAHRTGIYARFSVGKAVP